MMRFKVREALVLVACVGMAAGAWGQMEKNKQESKPAETSKPVQTMRESEHRSCHWLSSREVVGRDGQKVGKVSDLLIDRGSGRVEYAILNTGAVLGMGGRTIAAPFDAMRWDSAKEQFEYSVTADDLKQMPRWTEKDWSEQISSSRPAEAKQPGEGRAGEERSFSEYYYQREGQRPQYWDPYGAGLDTAKGGKLSGQVTSVERVQTANAGEQTVVTVKDSGGATQRVALGPSWFVNASGITPQRGDTITVETYAVRGTTDGMCVASTYQINQRDLSLRSANSEPLWSQHSYESEGRWYHQPYYRYVTASRLRGMDLQCGGQRCGSVDDVIVNVNGARVDLLSIDPDKNFLGIADTKYLMPWTVVTVGVDNKAHADATKDMILAGVKTPEDLKTINSETVNQVYAAYQVKPPTTSMDRSTGTGLPPAKETRPMTPPAKPEETKPGEKK